MPKMDVKSQVKRGSPKLIHSDRDRISSKPTTEVEHMVILRHFQDVHRSGQINPTCLS